MAKIETEAEDISGDVKADIETDKKLTQEDKQEDITESNSQSTSSVPQIQPGSGNDEYSIQDKVNLLSKIVPADYHHSQYFVHFRPLIRKSSNPTRDGIKYQKILPRPYHKIQACQLSYGQDRNRS
jgi:hypothetical protein